MTDPGLLIPAILSDAARSCMRPFRSEESGRAGKFPPILVHGAWDPCLRKVRFCLNDCLPGLLRAIRCGDMIGRKDSNGT